jgi:hypothetical protein
MYEAYTPSIFKREYIYYALFWRGFSSFSGYREDIENLNIKKWELLKLISL